MKTNSIILLPVIIAILLFFFSAPLFSQVNIDIETISEKCKDKSIEDKVKVTVARFNVTARARKANASFGEELVTMLTNTLQNVNCFRVLESLQNLSDMTDELDMGSSKYVDQEAASSIGKMHGAQAVFTGEITEFEQNDIGGGAFGVAVATNKTTVGFIIKLINIETRDLIWSESVEATGRTPGSYSGAQVLGLNLAGGKKKGNSLGDNVERGMIKAIYKLTEEMDELSFPEVDDIDYSNTEITTIRIENTNFSKVRMLRKLLGAKEEVHSVIQKEVILEKVKKEIAKQRGIRNLELVAEEATNAMARKAILTIRHEGNIDEFMDLLDSIGGNLFEITNQFGKSVEITMK